MKIKTLLRGIILLFFIPIYIVLTISLLTTYLLVLFYRLHIKIEGIL